MSEQQHDVTYLREENKRLRDEISKLKTQNEFLKDKKTGYTLVK